jgi:hypothetical protein
MRHRVTLQPSSLNRWGLIALAAGVCISAFTLLSTCRSDRVTVNLQDPRSPKYAYRLDELALLQMAADDIFNLERKKQYGTIYDEYTSPDFKKSVSRRRFLIMSNCVETYLGGLQEFDSNDLGFVRQHQARQRHPFDILTRKIQREKAKVDEQLVFIPSGFNFKLNGLYWISKDKTFLQCIADSPQIEANTVPMPKATPVTEEQTQTAKASTAKTANNAAQPVASTEEAQSEQPPTPEAAPVQAVPASEPGNNVQTRPAGAGAVMDTRPEPEPEKLPTPPADQKKQGNSARLNRGVAMPLEPGEPTTAASN